MRSPEDQSGKFWPACRLVLLAVNLVVFYVYFQHAVEIVLAFGKYGAACDYCPWVYRSQWHFLTADAVAALAVFAACWITLGDLRPGRDMALLIATPALVVVVHGFLSGVEWLTG